MEASGTALPDAFGPFRVLHQIGAGALGPVFRADDAATGRGVAVKLFLLDLTPERVDAFASELARLVAAQLNHPAVAVPIASGLSGGHPYLAEEFVAADALDSAIHQHGPAPIVHAVQLAGHLAGALDYAAVVNVTHGALHPRDVLVAPDDTRLTGLGIAQALEKVGAPIPVRRPYTAPERGESGHWDRRADIFSLAAIVFELIWGRRLAGLGEEAASKLTPINGVDLATARDVFARALTVSPGDRFKTALEFVEALKSCLVAQPAAAIAEPPARESPPIRVEATPAPPMPEPTLFDSPASEPMIDLPIPPPRKLRLEDLGPSDESLFLPEAPEPPTPEPPHVASAKPHPTVEPRLPPDVDVPVDLPAIAHGQAAPEPRSRTVPIVAALLVGILIGFAGGYGFGRRSAPPAVSAPPAASASVPARAPASPVPAAPPPAAAGQEFTENAVPAAPAPKPPSPPPVAVDGRILVRSTPAGARVFVDGRERGRTPLALRDLGHGTHRVRLTYEGYVTEERQVALSQQRPSASLIVSLTRATRPVQPAGTSGGSFAGILVIESLPAGARVLIDGRAVGTTPITLSDVAAGSHVVRLEHDGYRRWSSAVRVVAGERNRVTASLEK